MLGGAVPLKLRKTPLIPKLHREANNRMALFLQNGSDRGRIDATRHGDGDKSGLTLGAFRQRVELCFPLHALAILARGRFLSIGGRDRAELRDSSGNDAQCKLELS